MKQVGYIVTLCLTLLLLNSCGLLRKQSKVEFKEEIVQKAEKEVVEKEEEVVEQKDVKQKEEKIVKDSSKESKIEFKGDLEVIENVSLKEGLNVLETKSGGTVFVVKKDDDISLVINRPDITVFNKNFDILEEFKKGLTDSSNTRTDTKSKESKESSSDIKAIHKNEKKYTPSLKVILIMIGLITGLGILIYRKFKN